MRMRNITIKGRGAMSEYSAVRSGKLQLKGSGSVGLRGKKKRKRRRSSQEVNEEDLRHGVISSLFRRMMLCMYVCIYNTGGWRRVRCEEMAGGRVLLLTCTGGYIQAMDTGRFRVGDPREEGRRGLRFTKVNRCVGYVGEGPEAGEVFSLVRAGETEKLAIKTAYGRYVSVATSGEIAGRTEAVGPREQWQLVFEEVMSCVYYYCCSTICCRGKLLCVPVAIDS